VKALILAAGRGSRLKEGIPKCLLRLQGRALIEHQIAALNACGVRDIGLVVGYRSDRVRKLLGNRVTYIENARPLETNSLYSLSLARDWIDGDFMLLNSDVVAHDTIYARLANASGSCLTFDSSSGGADEHMKVVLSGKRLIQIGKKLEPTNGRSVKAHGESLGLLKFDKVGAAMLLKAASQIVAEGGEQHWAPAAVQRIAPHHAINCIDITGLPWTEIDYIEDALFAKHEILPSIRASVTRRRGITQSVMAAIGSVGGLFEELF
jgi:choline kinase